MTKIHRHPDPDSLAQATAEFMQAAILERVKQVGRAHVVLAGGSTPRSTYQNLGRLLAQSELAAGSLEFYWGDERCVPLDDRASNFRMASESLLAPLPAGTFEAHPIECGGNAPAAAETYEGLLRLAFPSAARPRFDLVLLGLGDDGHTASLFPGSPWLAEAERWVAAEHVDELRAWRVSLTPPAINAARTVVFLVQGEAKADAVRQVMRAAHDPVRRPAQIVEPLDGELHWFLDEAAASRL